MSVHVFDNVISVNTQVRQQEGNLMEVTFLKSQGDHYVYPPLEDVSWVDREEVVPVQVTMDNWLRYRVESYSD